jgi:hypothetical protein
MEENKSAADDKLKFTVYSNAKAVPLRVKQVQTGGTTLAVPVLDPGASESESVHGPHY